jgi:formylglycine-generating enzyme required for sulfatase activity
MTISEGSYYSAAAMAAFAELVARHDRGETVDFEAEIRQHPEIERELEALHANWKRVDSLLGGLQVSESGLDALEREMREPRRPPDETTAAELERLSSPERANKRYSVRERLARGGMGEIWRIFDADLERDLAMKVIRTRGGEGGRTPDGHLLRRFLFEARLTARLDHPSIVPVHDIGVDKEGQLYFTMPLVRGRSLAEILDTRARVLDHGAHGDAAWTRPRVLEVILKVCDALAYAHAQGVVHRDLKPANVMVGRFGETYVMDWGLARVLSELDELDRDDVIGTPAYMAPEQAKGRLDEVGPRSDVYAVGAILYHLLAGRMPYAEFESSGPRPLLAAVRDAPPMPLDRIAFDAPPELIAIARKAMARTADARYPGMAAMAEDLRAYMEGRVVHAHERGALAEVRKWVARNRTLVAAMGAAVLVMIIGSMWFAWEQSRSASQILQLADLRRIDELERRADGLWPAIPANVPAFERWLAEARELQDRAPIHERTLLELRKEAREAGPPRRFDSNELQWRHDTLGDLVARIARFADRDPGVGAVASVTLRIEEARRIAQKSLVDAAHAWERAIASIADEMQCPMYRGLRIEPQVGLVPIGRDPVSGLWEFVHVQSGDAPPRGLDGSLVLDAKSGIVLVLVPGGRFHMGSVGAVAGDVGGPRTDPWADDDEEPLTPVEIVPFFMARHETTRAQWERLFGVREQGNPLEPRGSDPLEPQGSISWAEADRTLRRAGLELPTEAQWEYAARAGTTSRWWCGNEPGSLRGVANGGGMHDARDASEDAQRAVRVDALRANPFGLVHVHGNAAEWTRDTFAPYTDPPRAGDGARWTSENGLRSVRGGDFDSPPADMRSAAREPVARDNHDRHVGMRAARTIAPPGG